MPSSAQWSSSARLERNVGENWFCTDDESAAEDLVGEVDLLDGRVRDPRQLDHALVQQVAEGADRLGVRDLRVRAVELVEPDRVDAESLRRRLGRRLQVLGAPSRVHEPSPGRRWPPLVATSTSEVSPP